MQTSLSNHGLQAAFAPANGMALTLAPERRVALGMLAQPIKSYRDYAQADLPLVIGTLGAEQQQALAAKLVLPPMRHHTTTTTRDVGSDFIMLATSLTQVDVMQTLRPIVSDILQFDRATFNDRILGVDSYFFRDTPGPETVIAPRWHREHHYNVEYPNNWSKYLTSQMPPRRIYTVRTGSAMETIRDRAGLTPEGRAVANHAHQRDPASPAYHLWLQTVKAMGLFLQPKPFEVLLMTGEATLHKSHQPLIAEPSAYLQLRMITAPIAAPRRIWLPDLSPLLRSLLRN